MSNLLTTKECASLFGISRYTLAKWIENGEIAGSTVRRDSKVLPHGYRGFH